MGATRGEKPAEWIERQAKRKGIGMGFDENEMAQPRHDPGTRRRGNHLEICYKENCFLWIRGCWCGKNGKAMARFLWRRFSAIRGIRFCENGAYLIRAKAHIHFT